MRPEPTAQRSADPVGRRARALCRASCLATRGRGDHGRGSFGHAGRGCVALRTCAAISTTIPCLYFFRIAHMRFTRLVCTRGTTATVRQSNDSCSTKDVRQGTLNLCVVWRWHPTTIALEASATAAPQTSRQLQIPRSDDLRLFISSDQPFRRKAFVENRSTMLRIFASNIADSLGTHA